GLLDSRMCSLSGNSRLCFGHLIRAVMIHGRFPTKKGFKPSTCCDEPSNMEVEVVSVARETIADKTGPRILDGRTAWNQQIKGNQRLRIGRGLHNRPVHLLLIVAVVGKAFMRRISCIGPGLVPDILHSPGSYTIEIPVQCPKRHD